MPQLSKTEVVRETDLSSLSRDSRTTSEFYANGRPLYPVKRPFLAKPKNSVMCEKLFLALTGRSVKQFVRER